MWNVKLERKAVMKMHTSYFSQNNASDQEYIIKEKRVSNFAIANVECMRKVT